jgi:hypothetical protein
MFTSYLQNVFGEELEDKARGLAIKSMGFEHDEKKVEGDDACQTSDAMMTNEASD